MSHCLAMDMFTDPFPRNGRLCWLQNSGSQQVQKGKAIPVTGRGGPQGCEMLRLPHFLDNRLTGGGEPVSLTRQPPFSPRKIPGNNFCQRPNPPQGHSAAGKIRSIKKSDDLNENRTRDLPTCCIVPQPTIVPCAPGCQQTCDNIN
jgi:hypothetical protein